MTVVAPKKEFSLIDELLAEQQRLQTPVARFAGAHVRGDAAQLSALSVQLVPLTAPGPGEQYAFEVNLDACTGCKACVAACHSLNGLDENETWRDTGLLVGGDDAHPFQQVVTTACHHCADPGCLNGCPVLAYEKDPVTGIVRHLDDQCIGCSYCILKCPYDVPKYNPARGIVRKCDMCQSRLAHGEAPACAQACPTHAIGIVTVRIGPDNDGQAAAESTAAFLPGAPDPSYTRPTTRYVTERAQPENLRAADAGSLRPQPPHWPLVWMLVLTQLSVGMLAADLGGRKELRYHMATFSAVPLPSLAWAALAAGLIASVLHLGQPLKAWRCFLGLRRSWLSREIVVFGFFFATLSWFAVMRPDDLALGLITVAAGLLGVFCSAMLYADTHRRAWRLWAGAGKFFGTTLVAGLVFVSLPLAALVLGAKLLLEGTSLRGAEVTSCLWRGPLRPAVMLRFVFGAGALLAFAGGFRLPGLLFFIAGELAERYLFFRAVDAPKMPGLPAI